MIWINIVFWAFVVVSISVSSRKPSFYNYYSSTIFDDYMAKGHYEKAFYFIMDSLFSGRYGIDAVVDDMIQRFNNECTSSPRLSDRVFGKVATHIVQAARKKTKSINNLYNISVCLGYCCYDTVKTLFTVCCFITFFGHIHCSYLLAHLDDRFFLP